MSHFYQIPKFSTTVNLVDPIKTDGIGKGVCRVENEFENGGRQRCSAIYVIANRLVPSSTSRPLLEVRGYSPTGNTKYEETAEDTHEYEAEIEPTHDILRSTM